MIQAEIAPLSGEDDLAGVMEVDRSSFPRPWSREMYLAELEHDRVSSILVLRTPECRVAGYCLYWLVADEIHINNVAVRPQYRGLGFAKRLLNRALREGRGRGAVRALLEVREGATDALQLYQGMGFAAIGRRRGYYSQPDEDALVMELDLQNLESKPEA